MEVVENDVAEALTIFKDIKNASKECLQHLRALNAKVKRGPSTSQGISFLDVKNQLMASYMTNLSFLIDKKTSGQSVQDKPSIDRLIEIRTVLEKMRPIEQKLRYQINKVVTTYKEGKIDPSDPRKFRANFGAFANMPNANSSDDEGLGEADNAKTEGRSKLYVAPKLAPVHYSDDETAEERMKSKKEKTKKRALSSAMLKEMREQYTDAPVEITESQNLHRLRDNRKNIERTEFEENNFVRLSVSRKESTAMKRLGTMSALGALADFGDIGDGDRNSEGGPSKKKKKGMAMNKKKKGKGHGKKGGRKQRR